MKKHDYTPRKCLDRILVGILLTLSSTVSGQVMFPAEGAIWHQHMEYGSFYCFVLGDTTIKGQKAKLIRQESRVKPPWSDQGLQVLNLRTLAVYTRSDTTFVYNKFFDRFTPLYIYNASEGDSICLPLVDPGGGKALFGNWGDSTFCFIVDSIRAVLYDQHLLRTYYTRSYRQNNTIELNWGPPQRGGYADRIGGLFTGFLPQCVPNTSCLTLATDTRQPSEYIRCYHDLQYNIQLVSDDCENQGKSEILNRKPAKQSISIGPNPTRGILYLYPGDQEIIRMDIFEGSGSLIFSFSRPGTQVDLKGISPGLYFVRIWTMSGPLRRMKLVIL